MAFRKFLAAPFAMACPSRASSCWIKLPNEVGVAALSRGEAVFGAGCPVTACVSCASSCCTRPLKEPAAVAFEAGGVSVAVPVTAWVS